MLPGCLSDLASKYLKILHLNLSIVIIYVYSQMLLTKLKIFTFQKQLPRVSHQYLSKFSIFKKRNLTTLVTEKEPVCILPADSILWSDISAKEVKRRRKLPSNIPLTPTKRFIVWKVKRISPHLKVVTFKYLRQKASFLFNAQTNFFQMAKRCSP